MIIQDLQACSYEYLARIYEGKNREIVRMSMQTFQKALAYVYTDRKLREALVRGDDFVLASFSLEEQEKRQLHRFVVANYDGLEFFSRLLDKKKGVRVSSLFPRTTKFLGAFNWKIVWSAYRLQNPSEGDLSTEAEAQRFATFLRSWFSKETLEDRIAVNLALYDLCRLSVKSQPKALHFQEKTNDIDRTLLSVTTSFPIAHPGFQLQHFQLDLCTVIKGLKHDAMSEVSEAPTTLLFYRNWLDGRVHVAKVTPVLGVLIQQCKGDLDVSTIAERLREYATDHKLTLEHVARMIRDLVACGALRLLNTFTP
jgi:hypothetical protein